MLTETKSELSIIYKVIIVLLFIFVLNQIFARWFKDLRVPFNPRIFDNRQNMTTLTNNTPVRYEFVEEFLTALQNKRNRIITGTPYDQASVT